MTHMTHELLLHVIFALSSIMPRRPPSPPPPALSTPNLPRAPVSQISFVRDESVVFPANARALARRVQQGASECPACQLISLCVCVCVCVCVLCVCVYVCVCVCVCVRASQPPRGRDPCLKVKRTPILPRAELPASWNCTDRTAVEPPNAFEACPGC